MLCALLTDEWEATLKVSNFVGEKVDLLERHWTLPVGYKMPCSSRTICGKEEKRFLQILGFFRMQTRSHLQGVRFVWSASSWPQSVKIKETSCDPFNQVWSTIWAGGYITSHEYAEYHKTSMIRVTCFLASMAKNTTIWPTALDSGRSQQIMENRQRLRPIVLSFFVEGRISLCVVTGMMVIVEL